MTDDELKKLADSFVVACRENNVNCLLVIDTGTSTCSGLVTKSFECTKAMLQNLHGSLAQAYYGVKMEDSEIIRHERTRNASDTN